MRNYMLLTHPHHKCILVVFSLCLELSLYLISCTQTLIQSICPRDKFIPIYLGKKNPHWSCSDYQITANTSS